MKLTTFYLTLLILKHAEIIYKCKICVRNNIFTAKIKLINHIHMDYTLSNRFWTNELYTKRYRTMFINIKVKLILSLAT